MAALADLLARAAVRIDVDSKPNGSGFLITPTTVVTCHHVLEPYLATSDQGRPTLRVFDANGRSHDVAGDLKGTSEHDVALLHLTSPVTDLPVVHLEDGVDPGDKLLSFGFREKRPSGEPTTFEAEGYTGGTSQQIKFKEGQVRPGTSGSALLNLRTGAVCGVVKMTRSQASDLGGYGIPAAKVFGLDESVPGRNRKAVLADRQWLAAMPPEQRRRVEAAGAPTVEDYLEFLIHVQQRDEGWLVVAKTEPGGPVADVPVDLNAVRAEVPRLFRAWKARARLDDAEQCRLLGHVLYRSIAPQAIGQSLERLAFEEKRQVHVSLCFEPEMDTDLVHLPWEQLFVRGRSVKAAIGARDGSTVTRVAECTVERSPRPPGEQAEVLVISGPQGAREVPPALGDVQRSLGSRGNLVQTTTPNPQLTLDDLETLATERRLDVLHYVGFGHYVSRREEITLSDGEFGVEYVDADQLAQALFTKPPTLVVLETFLADEPQIPVDPTALAATLLNTGIEAIVAFPYPLAREDAATAINKLYEQLDDGLPIRLAVQRSRQLLRSAPWSRPALFMRRPSDLRLVAGR